MMLFESHNNHSARCVKWKIKLFRYSNWKIIKLNFSLSFKDFWNWIIIVLNNVHFAKKTLQLHKWNFFNIERSSTLGKCYLHSIYTLLRKKCNLIFLTLSRFFNICLNHKNQLWHVNEVQYNNLAYAIGQVWTCCQLFEFEFCIFYQVCNDKYYSKFNISSTLALKKWNISIKLYSLKTFHEYQKCALISIKFFSFYFLIF